MSALNANATLNRNDAKVAQNGGRPVYDVCRHGSNDVVGTIRLGEDDMWRIDGAESDPWKSATDAVRMVLAGAA